MLDDKTSGITALFLLAVAELVYGKATIPAVRFETNPPANWHEGE